MKLHENQVLAPQLEIFQRIRDWAQVRGLYEKGDAKTQYCKLGEEFGELGRALIKNNTEEAIDAIGDMVVVLTNLAKLVGDESMKRCDVCEDGEVFDEEGLYDHECDMCAHGLIIEECIEIVWQEIKNRKGSMKNGSFVKAE